MIELGCHLSSEEFGPHKLIEQARMAEDAGFTFATISDHFHPWTTKQGHSPFVWAVIGAISQNTRTLRLGTAVTCPLIRMHPALVAQAAATCGLLMEGRFFLGLGTGEKLNEHITGAAWPEADTRWQMLEEAIQVIRLLWKGGVQNFAGRFYQVQDAELFCRPRHTPELLIAANAEKSAEIAGRLGDGMIGLAPKKELLNKFQAAGGRDKKRIGNITISYATSEEQAKRIAFETWPTDGLSDSKLHWNLPTPKAFEQAVQAEKVTPEMVARKVVCSPKPEDHVQAILKYAEAGFTHVNIKQCGPLQREFFAFYREQVMPRVQSLVVHS